MSKRVKIHHTWAEDRGETRWLFWLQKQLEAMGVQTNIEPLEKRELKPQWLETIKNDYEVADTNVYSINHDPGCLTILKYIEYLKDHDVSDTHLLIAGPQQSAAYSYIRLEGPKEIAIFNGQPSPKPVPHLQSAHLVILYSADPEQLSSGESLKLASVKSR